MGVLDELEGQGQAKRLAARICAQIDNSIRLYGWTIHGGKDVPVPTMRDESHWLPRRTKAKTLRSKPQAPSTKHQALNKRLDGLITSIWGADIMQRLESLRPKSTT
jgi:hypothetical protein